MTSWIDHTETGKAWFAEMGKAPVGGPPPPLGLHVVMGPGFREMAANLGRSLVDGRVGLVEAILQRG